MIKKLFLSLGLVAASTTLSALDFDFSGTFTWDNDVTQFHFTVGEDSTVTVFSSSWDDGGFDPILAIWSSSGSLMNEQDDGGNVGSTTSNGVSYTHGVWDSYYSVFLSAGSYIATVTQYANFANGSLLSQGFSQDGDENRNFTQAYGPSDLFNGVYSSNDPRTANYMFHILNVAAATHEPPHGVPDASPTFLLLSLGLLGLACARNRKA